MGGNSKILSDEMRVSSDVLFCPLAIEPVDRARAMAEIFMVPEPYWYADPYRNCSLLPVYTEGGSSTRMQNTITMRRELVWTEAAEKFLPYLREYVQTQFFPFMKPLGRVMIIRTPGETSNYEHIDCMPSELTKLQHKVRTVLRGRSDTLYFVNGNGCRHFAPETEFPFVMDGGWPHGMTNTDKETKFTLAIGAPWAGAPTPEYSRLLIESAEKFKNASLWRTQIKLPRDLSPFFLNAHKPSYDKQKEFVHRWQDSGEALKLP